MSTSVDGGRAQFTVRCLVRGLAEFWAARSAVPLAIIVIVAYVSGMITIFSWWSHNVTGLFMIGIITLALPVLLGVFVGLFCLVSVHVMSVHVEKRRGGTG